MGSTPRSKFHRPPLCKKIFKFVQNEPKERQERDCCTVQHGMNPPYGRAKRERKHSNGGDPEAPSMLRRAALRPPANFASDYNDACGEKKSSLFSNLINRSQLSNRGHQEKMNACTNNCPMETESRLSRPRGKKPLPGCKQTETLTVGRRTVAPDRPRFSFLLGTRPKPGRASRILTHASDSRGWVFHTSSTCLDGSTQPPRLVFLIASAHWVTILACTNKYTVMNAAAVTTLTSSLVLSADCSSGLLPGGTTIYTYTHICCV